MKLYEGHSMVHPVTGECLSKRQHWYTVECACGVCETINQAQLNDRDCCLECTRDSRGRKISATKRWQHRQLEKETREQEKDQPDELLDLPGLSLGGTTVS